MLESIVCNYISVRKKWSWLICGCNDSKMDERQERWQNENNEVEFGFVSRRINVRSMLLCASPLWGNIHMLLVMARCTESKTWLHVSLRIINLTARLRYPVSTDNKKWVFPGTEPSLLSTTVESTERFHSSYEGQHGDHPQGIHRCYPSWRTNVNYEYDI